MKVHWLTQLRMYFGAPELDFLGVQLLTVFFIHVRTFIKKIIVRKIKVALCLSKPEVPRILKLGT